MMNTYFKHDKFSHLSREVYILQKRARTPTHHTRFQEHGNLNANSYIDLCLLQGHFLRYIWRILFDKTPVLGMNLKHWCIHLSVKLKMYHFDSFFKYDCLARRRRENWNLCFLLTMVAALQENSGKLGKNDTKEEKGCQFSCRLPQAEFQRVAYYQAEKHFFTNLFWFKV